ncbi:hypothetical protein [Parasitella parasitica]|uniref:Isochorismatase-like domain-containing protein n=1 Tax=Parasitella parasitica TaxID=35722 RepID=A0A0B7NGH7_9FUNG|nr:hypothetical protein [Parasitella parasitica]
MSLLPNSIYIARPGQTNAWDNERFVKKAGYEVFVVADASGAFSEAVNEASWLRMQQVGIQLMNWFGFACELGRDWRKDINGMAALSATNAYLLMLMDSFAGAQAAAKASS